MPSEVVMASLTSSLFRFTGVAPAANLQAYKVFSTVDGTEEDVIIDAFLMAYDDGVCQIETYGSEREKTD